MERAQSLQVDAGTFQRNKVRYNIHDVCRIQYFIYRKSVYHIISRPSPRSPSMGRASSLGWAFVFFANLDKNNEKLSCCQKKSVSLQSNL
jgi:hypothetical protein